MSLFHFIPIDYFTIQCMYNPVTSLTIPVRIHGLRHTLVGGGVVEEGADFANDKVVVSSYKMYCATLKGFRTFGGVAHHEHRFAKTGSFFLNAATVGEDDGGLLHQIDELKVLQRLDEEEVACARWG